MTVSRRGVDLCLWLGLVAGTALVVYLLVDAPAVTPRSGQGPRAAAVVNGVAVPQHKFFGALAALTARARGPRPDAALRQRILEQLIVEELLLGRALELGLPRTEPVTRRRLVSAMIEHATAGVDQAPPPTKKQRRAFYDDHPELFSGTQRYVARRMLFRGGGAQSLKRARLAHRELQQGVGFDQVRRQRGDLPMVPLPAGPLPESALRQYLGPTAARAVIELTAGQHSAPVKGSDGHTILLLQRRVPGPRPSFEQVRGAVASLILRRQRDAVLKRYLARLRRGASVTINRKLLQADTPIPARYLQRARGAPAESNGR